MIITLHQGQFIAPKRTINPTMVRHWRYAAECADIGGGLTTAARLKVVEVRKIPGDMWVRAELLHTDPPRSLKIAGEEYAHNFQVVASA